MQGVQAKSGGMRENSRAVEGEVMETHQGFSPLERAGSLRGAATRVRS